MRKLIYLFILGILSCNLEQDLTIELPYHQRQLVVECYLEPNFPYQLLLTESSPYFASQSLPFVNDALVTITYKDQTDTLRLNEKLDQTVGKVFNYVSDKVVPSDFKSDFYLEIMDSKGRKITGKTKIKPEQSFTKVEYKFNNDSLAFVIAYLNDNANESNYYRFIVHKNKFSNIIQNFILDDKIYNGNQIPLATAYSFEKQDTAFVTLFHIDEEYYNYLESVEQARNSNANPFSQPSAINSNVQGGIGVFTGFSYERREVIIR